MVVADRARLRQIAWNVLTNAVKFTPEGGRIDVTLGRQNGEMHLEVRDTGVGIEPVFLPYVFDPFRQGDASPSRAHGGVGLGLAIARQLATLHGGRIEVASEGQTHGTTFIVSVPLADEDSEPEEAPAAAEPVHILNGVRVLLVDDDPEAAELSRELLEQRGAQVTVCTAGDRALTELPKLSPQLLICEIDLPEMGGSEVLRQARELQPGLRALALTRRDRLDNDAVATGGFDHLLAKPFAADALVSATLQTLLLPPPREP